MNRRSSLCAVLFFAMMDCGATATEESAGVPTVAPAARPRVTALEVQRALAKGDTDGAREMVRRLASIGGVTPEVRDLRDAVMLSEARPLTGDAKLELLDPIVERGGAHSGEAAKAAKAERLREAQQLIDGQRPADAIAALAGWFGDTGTSDPEVREELAKAHDAAFVLCSEPSCHYVEASKANASASTPERATRVAGARATVVAALSFQEAPAESTLDRLRRLRTFGEATSKMAVALAEDPELQRKAASASDLAQSERAKTPLLGSEEATAEELLGPLVKQSPRVAFASLGSFLVYLNLDARRTCRGIYVVGQDSASRSMDVSDDVLRKVLSQAVGRAANIKGVASATTTTTSWTEGTVPILARWKHGMLMELRIGDAAP
jgi:hypothetical protein